MVFVWQKLIAWIRLVTILVIGVCLGFKSRPVYDVIAEMSFGKHIQTVESPWLQHSAKLSKRTFIDLNFLVDVDGERVYVSPDYMPRTDGQYRETLLWDKSGRIVCLELMGAKVFAYDAVDRQPLNGHDLAGFEFSPEISDLNYGPIVDLGSK